MGTLLTHFFFTWLLNWRGQKITKKIQKKKNYIKVQFM